MLTSSGSSCDCKLHWHVCICMHAMGQSSQKGYDMSHVDMST